MLASAAAGYTHCLMLPSFPPDVSRSSQSARVFHFDKHGNGHAGVRTRRSPVHIPTDAEQKEDVLFFFFPHRPSFATRALVPGAAKAGKAL